ncbi:hypothetical protein Tco_1201707 [Tanacetum coccineum]
MPPGIESDDYDSEGDFRFLEELLINDSLPLPENESYNLDGFDVLNNDESFDSGEGENVEFLNVEEEDSFTFTIRSISKTIVHPYPSSKELVPSKALLTLDVFDPLHPPLMNFHEKDVVAINPQSIAVECGVRTKNTEVELISDILLEKA